MIQKNVVREIFRLFGVVVIGAAANGAAVTAPLIAAKSKNHQILLWVDRYQLTHHSQCRITSVRGRPPIVAVGAKTRGLRAVINPIGAENLLVAPRTLPSLEQAKSRKIPRSGIKTAITQYLIRLVGPPLTGNADFVGNAVVPILGGGLPCR